MRWLLLMLLLRRLLVGQLGRTGSRPGTLPGAVEERTDLGPLRVRALSHEGRERRVGVGVGRELSGSHHCLGRRGGRDGVLL